MSPDHGFHTLRVKRVVDETHDAKSFVLDVPADLQSAFAYEAGQFCTFRAHFGDEDLLRCYSMSSSPHTDHDLAVTVKRVAGGRVSNWMLDEIAAGDVLTLTLPAGVFTLQDRSTPVVAFCGGSGITPVFSIVKSALSDTERAVRVLYANRDASSVIFRAELDELVERHPDRLDVVHHLDADQGFVHATAVTAFVGPDRDADFYLCGPGPFMDIVEDALTEAGVPDDRRFIERFAFAASARPPEPVTATAGDANGGTETVVVVLDGREHEVKYHEGETFLETARRAGLRPPFSCEAGSCATCMAFLREGEARIRVNNALEPEEVEEGWVLTCQGLPTSPTATVVYEP